MISVWHFLNIHRGQSRKVSKRCRIIGIEKSLDCVKISDEQASCRLVIVNRYMEVLNTKETFLFYDLKVRRYHYGANDLFVGYDCYSCISITSHTITNVFIDAETTLYYFYKQHPERNMHVELQTKGTIPHGISQPVFLSAEHGN